MNKTLGEELREIHAEFIIGRIRGAITFLEKIMSGVESLVRKEKADANERL